MFIRFAIFFFNWRIKYIVELNYFSTSHFLKYWELSLLYKFAALSSSTFFICVLDSVSLGIDEVTFVTVFGKNSLNEICVRMHFNAFWMHYNAFQRSPMIRNALTTFRIDGRQFWLMFHNDFPTFFNALATFSNVVILKAIPLWPVNYELLKHRHVRTLQNTPRFRVTSDYLVPTWAN